jgi:hypothetical protein
MPIDHDTPRDYDTACNGHAPGRVFRWHPAIRAEMPLVDRGLPLDHVYDVLPQFGQRLQQKR